MLREFDDGGADLPVGADGLAVRVVADGVGADACERGDPGRAEVAGCLAGEADEFCTLLGRFEDLLIFDLVAE